MATLPFSSAFVNRLTDREHAYRFICESGEVVHFLYFCCDDPYQFTVPKAPVAVISIAPDVQCTGQNLVFNIDSSYVPLGTLASYNIAWGDGTSTGAGWGGGPGNINHQYANSGTYTVTVTVTDTLGTSGSVQAQVLIVDCSSETVLIRQMYALSQTAGPYLRDMTAAGPAWAQRVQGLGAGTMLQGRDLKLDPHRRHLPAGVRHIWVATAGGVAKSTIGMDAWAVLTSRLGQPDNAAGDAPAPTFADLNWLCIAFNHRWRDEVYVLAGKSVAPVRTWVWWTTDGGITWANWQVRW